MIYDNGDLSRGDGHARMELGRLEGFQEAPRRGAEAQASCAASGLQLHRNTGGYPRERAEITVQPDGEVDVVVGTLSSGQGHETSFAQCVTEWLGVPFDDVRSVHGDTDIVKVGGGSHSGRARCGSAAS